MRRLHTSVEEDRALALVASVLGGVVIAHEEIEEVEPQAS